MADFWGPGLDAELAYRHERLFTALRATPYGDTHDSRGGDHDDLVAATTHEPGSASALAASARPDGSLRPVGPAHPLATAARGWLLRGSGAWHVAR